LIAEEVEKRGTNLPRINYKKDRKQKNPKRKKKKKKKKEKKKKRKEDNFNLRQLY